MKPSLRITNTLLPDNQGFTLLETLIGLLVFTIGILAVSTMTTWAIKGYTVSRTNTAEVNRTTANTEALKQVNYGNSDVFSATGTSTAVQGSEGEVLNYADTDDVVVLGTKLIVVQNNQINGGDGNYTLYYTKPVIQ